MYCVESSRMRISGDLKKEKVRERARERESQPHFVQGHKPFITTLEKERAAFGLKSSAAPTLAPCFGRGGPTVREGNIPPRGGTKTRTHRTMNHILPDGDPAILTTDLLSEETGRHAPATTA